VDVVLDQDVPDIVMRPTPGRLYLIAGAIYNPVNSRGVQTTVTLVSDMGSETVTADTDGRFQFSPVAPGKYEVYAQAFGGRGVGVTSAFQALDIERSQTELRLAMRAEPDVQFVFEDTHGAPLDSSAIQVLARQKQLLGDGPTQFVRADVTHKTFAPGRWEFSLPPNYAFYLAGFHGPNRDTRPGERAEGWNEVLLNQATPVVRFVLSTSPAAVHGSVANAAGDQVAGVPVFLEPYDAGQRRRLGELRTTRTDIHGQFQFTGLAPGAYRILSTFEFQAPDAAAMGAAGASAIRLEEGATLPLNLSLYAR
jgi:hypothetical protein